MESVSPFTRIDPDLVPVLDELRRREPIFHTAAFGTTVAEFERMMAPDYWEIGASGRRYSRDFILGYLERFPPVDAETEGWVCSDFGLGSLGPQTYLLTYTLDQAGRVTRRATIWQRSDVEWRVLYHQGTLVVARVDDTLPSKRETSPQ
jgi:hypothetical protein